jgi:hypothetical protein
MNFASVSAGAFLLPIGARQFGAVQVDKIGLEARAKRTEIAIPPLHGMCVMDIWLVARRLMLAAAYVGPSFAAAMAPQPSRTCYNPYRNLCPADEPTHTEDLAPPVGGIVASGHVTVVVQDTITGAYIVAPVPATWMSHVYFGPRRSLYNRLKKLADSYSS